MRSYVTQKFGHIFILILAGILGGAMLIRWQAEPRPVFAQSLDQIGVSISVFDAENEAVNGTFLVRFALYAQDRTSADPYPSSSDARLWEETKEVTVKNGILRSSLGELVPLPEGVFTSAGDYYLGIRLGEDSELVPRKRVISVPSALNARLLDGRTVGENEGDLIALGSGGRIDIDLLPVDDILSEVDVLVHDQNTDAGTDSIAFNIGSGTALGTENFDFTVSNAAAKPTLRYNSSLGAWELSNDGSLFETIRTGSISITNGGTGLTAIPTEGQLMIGNGTGYSLAAVSGDASLTSAGALTVANGAITGAKIADGTIREVDLAAVNAPIGGQVLTYDSTTGGFSWSSVSAGAGVVVTNTGAAITIGSTLGASISSTEIENGTIRAVDLRTTNAPADTQILVYDEASDGFIWSSPGFGSIGDITGVGDATTGDAFSETSTEGSSLWFYDADGHGRLTVADLATDHTYLLPDASGTIYTTGNDPYDTAAEIRDVFVGGDATGTVGNIAVTDDSHSHTATTLPANISYLGSDIDLASESTGVLGVTRGGTGTATQFTPGAVVFAGASGVYAQNDTGFFWDNAQARLGIGTTTPSASLEVNGSIVTSDGSSVQWGAAYGWGNHALAGYLTGNQTITLSGDVSGSGTTSIVTSLAANSVADDEIDYATVTLADFTNDAGFVTTSDDTVSGSELDGVFSTNGLLRRTASGTYDTITDNSSNWNTAYSWGNHANQGYLTSEVDASTTNELQDLFSTIAVSGQSNIVADQNTDTLTLVGGTNVTITTNASTDTVTIAATDTNTTYSASGTLLNLSGTTFSVNEGTLTSGRGCRYVSGTGLVCDQQYLSGNQTITLTGDVTGSGTTSIATSLATNSVSDNEINYATVTLADFTNDAGFVTTSDDTVSGSELDGVFSTNGLLKRTGTSTYTTITDNSGNWDTAYSWGNHANQGYLTSYGIGDSVTSGTSGSILFVDASGQLAQDNSNLFWDDANNRLGIGIASPANSLHVVGKNASSASDFIALFQEQGITPEASDALDSGNADRGIMVQGDGGAFYLGRDVTNNIEFAMGTSTQGGAFAGSMTNHSFWLRTDNRNRLTILSSGNVGIGTDTPGAELDLSGTMRFSGSTSGYVALTAPAVAGTQSYVLPTTAGAAGDVLKTDASGNMYWAAVSGGSGGIGTVTSVGSGNGIAGGPITTSGTLSIDILSVADSAGSTGSYSGLEFGGTSGDQLTLLQGCADNEVLAWNETSGTWACSSVSGVGGVSGSGTTGYVTYWSGTSALSGEAQLSVSRGGTGLGTTPTNGQLLIGNGSGYSLATLTEGTGIMVTNGAGSITIANSDPGSSQSIFKTIAVSGQSNIVADSNTDTLTLVGGTNVTITTNASTDTVTIAATDTDTTYSASGTLLNLSGTTFSVNEGTLTSGRGCRYVSGTGLVCDQQYLSGNQTITLTGDVTGSGTTSIATSLATNSVSDNEINYATVTLADFVNDAGFITSPDDSVSGSELDGVFSTNGLLRRTASGTYDTITDSSGNWDTAYSWGNHANQGYLTSEVDASTTNELQDLFSTIAVSGQSNIVADQNTDTLTLVGGTNVTITTNASTDTVTIAATDTDTTYSASGTLLNLSGTTFSVNEGTLTSGRGCRYVSGTGLVCDQQYLSGNQTITLTGDVTGTGATSIATTIAANSVALGTDTTGDYVASITAGNGLSGSGTGEGSTPTLALGILTADWTQTGAYDVLLAHASSELRIMESSGGTYYGTFDVADLSANQTYAFGTGGTVYTTGNDPYDTSTEIQGVSVGGDATGTVGNIAVTDDSHSHTASTLPASTTYLGSDIDLASEVSGVLGTTHGGTGLSSTPQNGQLLIGNGSGYSLATLTQGSGVTVTNGAGSVTIATMLGASVESSEITDGTIVEADLATTNTATDGQIPIFDLDSGGFTWVSVAAGSGISVSNGAEAITISSSLGSSVNLTSEVSGILPVANGGTGTSTQFTIGSIVFAGASGVYAQDNANFFWDDANNRLGIGTTSPAQKLDIAGGSLRLDDTTYANQDGVIYKDSTPFLHNFNYGNNGTVTTIGGNLFLGENAGNFSMGETATATYQASYNTGIGQNALNSNTTGNDNSAVGGAALRSNTTGYQNSAVGRSALNSNTTGNRNSALGSYALRSNTTGSYNSALGADALSFNTTGHSNSALGTFALSFNTTGHSNSALGTFALSFNTTGYYNSAVGRSAGTYIDGDGINQAGNNSLFLGYDTRAHADGETNQIVIGASAIGLGSNSVVLGNASITHTVLRGNVGIGLSGTASARIETLGAGTTSATTNMLLADSAGTALLTVRDDGYTGIGTASPSELLTVSNGSTTGTYTTSGWAHSSDARLKTNVTALGGALDTVSRLQGVSFNWKTNPTGDRQIGFIAQDVLGVLPEVVTGNEEDGYGIAYGNLSALLVQAVKELHTEQGTVAASLESRFDTLDLGVDMNATTLAELRVSVDAQLDIVGGALSTLGEETDTLDGRLTALDSRVLANESDITDLVSTTNSLDARLADLEEEIATLRDQNTVLFDFYQTFELDRLVAIDEFGNVDLLDGALSASIVETGGLVIEVSDPEAPTIGTAVITPVEIDEDGDDVDDETGSDGMSVFVPTTAVTDRSKVFTSFQGNPGSSEWVEKEEGEESGFIGFTVHLEDPVSEEISVDWFIVSEGE